MQLTIDIKDDVYQKLQKKARVDSVPVEKEIQLIIEKTTESLTTDIHDPFINWLINDSKDASSGLGDVAINHDKYLYGSK